MRSSAWSRRRTQPCAAATICLLPRFHSHSDIPATRRGVPHYTTIRRTVLPAKVSLHRIILTKFKESLFSVTPVVALVCILYLTPLVSLTARELTVFLLSSVVLIIGT